MSIRHIEFGCHEHQQREILARHFHETAPNHCIYGDGSIICRVVKNSKLREAFVYVIGEDGFNEDFRPFNYADYFLPEELEHA